MKTSERSIAYSRAPASQSNAGLAAINSASPLSFCFFSISLLRKAATAAVAAVSSFWRTSLMSSFLIESSPPWFR